MNRFLIQISQSARQCLARKLPILDYVVVTVMPTVT